MARQYSRKHGKSGSKKPIKVVKKGWLRYSDKEIEALIVRIAKQGNKGSKIGLILRDVYGVPDVKIVTGKSISKILKENNLGSKLPEDLTALILKDIIIMKHLGNNKKDMPSLRGLTLTESKIKKLAKYYKKTGMLPQDWVFKRENAKLLLE
ncbi:30S ribosomal protein S15 [Candidatus Woesearchaeota archaeon]|nr:30S ribosomal protein S15 [Candidatus Woesearchaeota archaeon]